jgi:hypothetical protein
VPKLELYSSVGPHREQQVLFELVVVAREERPIGLALTPPNAQTFLIRPLEKSSRNVRLLLTPPLA